MNQTFISDNELIDLMNDDNALAFEVLCHRYWKKLFVTAVNKTQDQDLAQEITQEIFVDLWERRVSLKITNISAYLNAAIRFKVISGYKSQLETQIEYLEIPDNSTNDSLELKGFEKSLASAVSLLPQKTKEIFQMKFYVGGSVVVVTYKSLENPALNIGILKVDEGYFENNLWKTRRHMKGDQTHQGRHLRISVGDYEIQKTSTLFL